MSGTSSQAAANKETRVLAPPDIGDEEENDAKHAANASCIENGTAKNVVANYEPTGNKKKDDKEAPKTVGFFKVFRFASKLDVFLMIVAIVASIGHGLIQPLTMLIFGNILDNFADPTQYCSLMELMKANETVKQWYTKSSQMFNFSCTDLVYKNESQINGMMKDVLEKLPLDEQMFYVESLKWAEKSGFFDQMKEQCKMLLSWKSVFLSKIHEQITLFCVLAAASWVGGYLQSSCFGMAAENQVKKIRTIFFRQLIRQDICWYDQQDSGLVTSKFAEDILLIHKGIGEKIGLFVQCLAAFTAGLVIAFVKGWELTLVILSLSPMLAGAAFAMMKFAFTNAQGETKAYGKAGSVAQEVLSAIRTVTSFGGQRREVERYAANLEDARRHGTRTGLVMGVMMGFVFFSIFGAYALGFSYGIKLINDERPGYSFGVVFTVFGAAIMGTFSLGMGVPSIQGYAAARSAAYNVFQVIDRKPPIDAFSKKGKKRAPGEKFDCHIEFKNAAFHYPTRPDAQILNGVSLTIEPGTTVALVGPSGCGKSTIIQLLQRFYDPDSGSVFIDGTDLRDFNIFWFRSIIGTVSQEPILFGATIYENIRYGFPSVSKQEIEEAAKVANAHDFIVKLPQGYETNVGEQGAQLSGGQKQRIAIARALVRNPRILLLDEATSALDTESEAIVQEALDRARAGRTTISIAHRLSTVMNADKIIVIEAGKVLEVGTHAELIAMNGLYARLVKAQEGHDETEIDMEYDTAKERRAALAKGRRSEKEESTTSSGTPAPKQVEQLERQKSVHLTAAEQKKLDDALVKEHYSAKRLWSMARSEAPFLLLGTLGALVAGGVWPVFAIIFSRMADAFNECNKQTRYEKGLTYSLIFLAIGFANFLGFVLMFAFYSFSGERLCARIRKLLFHTMLRQEIAWFDHEDNSTGALSARLATQCGRVKDATGSNLGQLVQSVASLLTGIVIAFIYEWRITLIMLAFTPILIFGGLIQGKAAGDTVTQDKFIEDSTKYLVQSTTNIRTVTSLGIYRIFIDYFNEPLIKRHNRELIKKNIAGFFFGMSEGAMLFAYAAAFAAGAEFVTQGLCDFGEMFTALTGIMFCAMSVGQASAFAPDQRKAQIAVAEIFKLLDRKPAVEWEESAGGKKPGEFAAHALLEAVHFHYPTRPTAPILRGLNVDAQPGQTFALVGASGCGKSTVIQLLERFYDPVSGEVKLDGNPLPSLSLAWVRGKMALVSQEPTLFDRTIGENISYGVDSLRGAITGKSATQEEIESAARQANIHDFIVGLPDGYNTRVGERGGQLSGGQKQRIAIARALIRQPQLLLLDEATSALDSESEKVVQEALERARAGRTVVVIAHRLSTIEGADVIAVIQHGVIREMGTHRDLLEKRGLYYGLWSAQQLSR